MPDQTAFSGEIRVASKIVDYLSSGLYESPAACLKELVNNSYDADATDVSIFVKPDADRIIIEDNGIGMSKIEFVKHFSRISESTKRAESDRTRSGRPKIGKIGIGFIAANEICDVMEIFSTKRGSRELLHVNINFERLRLSTNERMRADGDVAKADYVGELLEASRKEHYTRVFLKNIRGEAKAILAGAKHRSRSSATETLYGLKPRSIVARLSSPTLKSWSSFDLYSQNLLRVALSIPVKYYDGWIEASLRRYTLQFERATAKLNFSVRYDGTELGKPIVLQSGTRTAFARRFSYSGKHVSAKGYFYVQHGVIRPQELNGLLIRIRHASVGGYDPSFLDFPSAEGTLFQRWISAEIWADDRLEDALNIDRKTLRISHPAYVDLQAALHEYLSSLIKEARERLHDVGALGRKQSKARASYEAIHSVVECSPKSCSPGGA
jgi:histidine kinase/DNA gyrase B/HSP90-like ATPase